MIRTKHEFTTVFTCNNDTGLNINLKPKDGASCIGLISEHIYINTFLNKMQEKKTTKYDFFLK